MASQAKLLLSITDPSELPDPVARKIFKYAGGEALILCERVSKPWKFFCEQAWDPQTPKWMKILIEDRTGQLIISGGDVGRISVRDWAKVADILRAVIQRVGEVNGLKLHHVTTESPHAVMNDGCCLSPILVHQIMRTMRWATEGLEKFSVSGIFTTFLELRHFLKKHKETLKQLNIDIDSSEIDRSSELFALYRGNMPQMMHLKIRLLNPSHAKTLCGKDRDSVRRMLVGKVNLVTLDISNIECIGARELAVFIGNCGPKVQEVTFGIGATAVSKINGFFKHSTDPKQAKITDHLRATLAGVKKVSIRFEARIMDPQEEDDPEVGVFARQLKLQGVEQISFIPKITDVFANVETVLLENFGGYEPESESEKDSEEAEGEQEEPEDDPDSEEDFEPDPQMEYGYQKFYEEMMRQRQFDKMEKELEQRCEHRQENRENGDVSEDDDEMGDKDGDGDGDGDNENGGNGEKVEAAVAGGHPYESQEAAVVDGVVDVALGFLREAKPVKEFVVGCIKSSALGMYDWEPHFRRLNGHSRSWTSIPWTTDLMEKPPIKEMLKKNDGNQVLLLAKVASPMATVVIVYPEGWMDDEGGWKPGDQREPFKGPDVDIGGTGVVAERGGIAEGGCQCIACTGENGRHRSLDGEEGKEKDHRSKRMKMGEDVE